MNALITGWGYYVPPKVLTNADLEAMVNTSDAWIYERTGIRARDIIEEHDLRAILPRKGAQLRVPADWRRTWTGEPMPNVVRLIERSRRGR